MAKGFKDDAQALLASLGITGNLTALVRKALIQGWSTDEFASRLIQTNAFRHAFPGLVNWKTGQIDGNFAGATGSISRDLLAAANKYNQGYDDFTNLAKRFGIKAPNKRVFAATIRNDISLEEFGVRLQARQTLKQNPGLLDAYNEVLKASGQKPFDEIGMLKFLAGAQASKFYDTYEAAQLKAAGFQLDTQAALRAAKAIGEPGKPMNIEPLIAQVQATLSDIGPEAARQGLSLEETIVSLAKGGQDAAGIGNTLRALMNQRRALGTYQPGIQAQRGAGGGLAQYTDEANNQLFAE